MEINKILGADYLDILFEGRNKDYGAYDLRKTYNKRLIRASIATVAILFLLIEGYLFTNKFSGSTLQIEDDSVHLVELKPDVIKPELPQLPRPKPEAVKVQITKFTSRPIIVKEDVPEDQKPPKVDQLENTVIGLINQAGVNESDITAPPERDGDRGIIMPPKKDVADDDGIFRKVEIESSYPGGAGAWMRYLNKTFRYPAEAQEIDLQGTIIVQFIVDKEGNISDVEAISGPVNGGLREEAIRVIRKSGKWEPAIQNGRPVKSYKKQPITFMLQAE